MEEDEEEEEENKKVKEITVNLRKEVKEKETGRDKRETRRMHRRIGQTFRYPPFHIHVVSRVFCRWFVETQCRRRTAGSSLLTRE